MMRDVLLAFFASENIDVETADDGRVMRVAFQGENGRFLGFVRAGDAAGVLALYTLCPIEVPADRMSDALELVARLNSTSVLGNLELDVDAGTMRYKTSIDVEGAELTEDLVANLVWSNVASLDRMLPAITAVVVKGARPRDAVQAIEGS
jgi:hypothetical protein